jgi:predicted acetyltransferase
MIRTLQEDDLEALFAIREVSFPGEDASGARERQLARLPWTRGYFIDGKLASAAGMYPFQMHFAGKLLEMGGLAGVQTPPEFRRRGLVRELLHDGLERLRDQGVGWCLEHPFDPRFYARYGWQSVLGGLQVSFPSELLQRKQRTEAQRLDPVAADITPLREIHRNWAARHNFPPSRSDASRRGWERIVKPPWKKKSALAYLLEGAYCLLRLERSPAGQLELTVSDYAFDSATGRGNLLAFLGNFAGQVRRVHMFLPTGEPLLSSLQAYIQPNTHSLQARVVDVKAALEPLSTEQELTFNLRVRDDFCDWNKQTLKVTFDNGIHVAPTRAEADLSLDVRTLALLLCGALEPEAAQSNGGLEGNLRYAEALTSLAGGRRPFLALADYF